MPLCIICNKEFLLNGRKYIPKTCSRECKLKLFSKINSGTYIEKYGKEKAKQIIDKINKNKSWYKHSEEAKIKIGNAHRKEKIYKENICYFCNKKFIYLYKYNNPKYCSKNCRKNGCSLIMKNKKRIWNFSKEEKQRISLRNKGKILSKETKQKMSIAHKGLLVNNGKKRYLYNNIFFRSNWEINFAKWCDINNMKYFYEPQIFKLTDTIYYTSDFYLPIWDMWVEIKGFWYEKSLEKVNLFKEKISSNLWVIDSFNYHRFDKNVKWQYTKYYKEYNPSFEEYLNEEFICGLEG